MRPRRRLSEVERRNANVHTGELAALAQHPLWPALAAEIDDKQQRIERMLLSGVLSPPPQPFDQRKADFWNGFIHGMRWFLAQPGRAEGELERAFKKAEGASR